MFVAPDAGDAGAVPPAQSTEVGQVIVIVAEGVTFNVNEYAVPVAGGFEKTYVMLPDGVDEKAFAVEQLSVAVVPFATKVSLYRVALKVELTVTAPLYVPPVIGI